MYFALFAPCSRHSIILAAALAGSIPCSRSDPRACPSLSPVKDISVAVQRSLGEMLSQYGYRVVRALVTGINPERWDSRKVKESRFIHEQSPPHRHPEKRPRNSTGGTPALRVPDMPFAQWYGSAVEQGDTSRAVPCHNRPRTA